MLELKTLLSDLDFVESVDIADMAEIVEISPSTLDASPAPQWRIRHIYKAIMLPILNYTYIAQFYK